MKSNVWWVLAAVALVLAVGSLARLLALRGAPREEFRQRIGSLAVWWIMLAGLALAGWIGRAGIVVLVTVIAGWALWEYFGLRAGGAARSLRVAVLVALPINAWLIYGDRYTAFLVFLPLTMLILLPVLLVLAGRTEGFLREAAETYWGVMLIGYGLSYLAYLSVLPESWNPPGGSAGWFVFVVVLTETNDIAQALWGRRFGVHPLARRVSPNKTWEGFIAGLVVTLGLSVVLGAWLTPLTSAPPPAWSEPLGLPAWWPAVAAAGLLAVSGLFGDLIISGLKRDAGVKDTGRVLPGQGGILDRVDSLLITSPAIFYFVQLLYGSTSP